MGVRKKGRRKISVGDTEYIWYVEMDRVKYFKIKTQMEFGTDIYYHLIFLRLLHHHLWLK